MDARSLPSWSGRRILSFELFGHLTGSVRDVEQAILRLTADLGPA
jgi:hypothetical protein